MNTDSDVNKAICLPVCEGQTVLCQLPSIFLYIATVFFSDTGVTPGAGHPTVTG